MDSLEWGAPVELRFDGRTLNGPVVRYGDIAPSYREMFGPRAFTSVADPLPLHIEHDRSTAVAVESLAVERRAEQLGLRATLPDGSAALRLIRSGAITGLSPEFVAISERREAGLRVIEQAELRGVGLVGDPAYKQSRIEMRSTRMALMRAGIYPQRRNSCECSGADCSYASFTAESLQEEADAINQGRDVLAFWGNYDNPLGSTMRDTVRVEWRGDHLGIELDLPDTDTGRKVIAANEDAGVVVRPYLDARRSVGQRIGEVMAYSAIFIRGFQVSASDAREGWPEPEIDLALNEGLLTEEELEELEAGTRRRRVFV